MKKELAKFLLKKLAQLGVLVSVFGFLAVKGPEVHTYILRHKIGKTLVKVTGNRSGGTGFHVTAPSGKTYILTNNHVCLLSDSKQMLNVTYPGANIPIKRKIVKRMEHHDLCLLEANDNIEGLSIADGLSVGEIIALIGYPGLRPMSFSRGEYIGETIIDLIFGINLKEELCIGLTLTAKQIAQNEQDEIMLKLMNIKTVCLAILRTTMLNAISYGGNSGSPVVNFFGNVVGVLFAGNPRQPTDSYMVPLDVIQTFLKDM